MSTIPHKTLHVCHLVSGDLWAGAEVHAYTLITSLAALPALQLQVITFNSGILSSRLAQHGVPVTTVEETTHTLPLMVWHTYRHLKKHTIDILHTHGFKENFIGGIAAKLCSLPAVVRTHHGKGMMHASTRHTLIEKINATYLSTKLIAVSHDLKEFLINQRCDPHKIAVIHNGIDLSTTTPRQDPVSLKKQLHLGDQVYTIGTIGRMVPIKGHRYFLEGAKHILSHYDQVRFVMVGDGPLKAAMEDYARSLGIEDHVRFTGFREDALDLLNLFDIFALTSLHEGIPLTLLDAMCLGKNIIATQVGGIPEVIVNNHNGLLIPPKDAKSFADACISLLQNRTLSTTLSANAKRDVVEKFSLPTTVHQIAQLYRELV